MNIFQYIVGDDDMKNILFVLGALLLLIVISKGVTESDLIPEDAIRIRVIANSDSEEDQTLKQEIRQDVESYLYNELKDAESVDEADLLIRKSIPGVKKIINSYTDDYTLNYGMNYFPQKEYKGITYEKGEYQSLVVTLGQGLGNNWWCVLFPPLCLLEAEESTDVEYHSYVVDMINKYFH